MSFTEGSYEKALIALFENLGYQHQYGPNIERDYYVPFYEEQHLEIMDSRLAISGKVMENLARQLMKPYLN